MRTAGGMGSITLGSAKSSDFLAGISATAPGYATDHDDFVNRSATIKSVRITGRRKSSGSFFVDSRFSGATFGTISIMNADFADGESGIYAMSADGGREIRRLTYRDTRTGERWSFPPRAGRLFTGPADLIHIL